VCVSLYYIYALCVVLITTFNSRCYALKKSFRKFYIIIFPGLYDNFSLKFVLHLEAVVTFHMLFAYLQLQQITLAAEEQAKVANENLSTLSATVKSKQVPCYPLTVTLHSLSLFKNHS
jgi:hypothetical protein